MAQKERIQKIMAVLGVGSRRYCDSLIEEGRVTVNGRPALIGTKIDPDQAIIFVDGKKIEKKKDLQFKYYILNKPRGYVTTMKDEMGRKCIAEFLSELPDRVYPVGRLDKNSEGLLLATNDGDLANFLMHPSGHVAKKYRVTITPDISEDQLVSMAEGIEIDGGRTAPAIVKVVAKETGRVVIELTIFEGKNRQIRKMCEALGLTVSRLKRTAIGPIKLGMLKPGQIRELTKDEIKALKISVQNRRI